jgi:hypothetical protein
MSDYSLAEIADAESYEWALIPEEAGVLTNEMNQASIVWNAEFRGEATLNAKASNNCGESEWSESLTIELFSTIGLNEFANGQLKVYPNPAATILNLEINSTDNKAVVSLSNLLGKEIWKEEITSLEAQTIQIPINNLQNGVYILNYQTKAANSSIPVMIRK